MMGDSMPGKYNLNNSVLVNILEINVFTKL